MNETFEMKDSEPGRMNTRDMVGLSNIILAPYMQLAWNLVGRPRASGENVFRHSVHTLGILINYRYISPILLKASLVHDILREIQDFDESAIKNADEDGERVLAVVRELTHDRKTETRAEFFKRIIRNGSFDAKLILIASRLDSLENLGYTTDEKSIEEYCMDTELYVLPLALQVNAYMYDELISFINSRRRFLGGKEFYFCPARKKHA